MSLKKKYTIELPDKAEAIMNALATEMGVPLSDVVKRGVALLSYVRKKTKNGEQLCIVKNDVVLIEIKL